MLKLSGAATMIISRLEMIIMVTEFQKNRSRASGTALEQNAVDLNHLIGSISLLSHRFAENRFPFFGSML